ncbi:MAG: glycosyltransferase [Acidobacteriota bacterium]
MTSRPLPIFYTLPNLVTAGSGRALFEIARRLDRTRFAPHLCLASRGGALERAFLDADIPGVEGAVTVPGMPRTSFPGRAWRAAQALEGVAPRGAIWHSFHYLDDYSEAVVARCCGARAWLYTKKNMSWSGRSWQLRTWGAKRVLVQNRDMMRDFFGGCWRRRARYVPRGVDTERFAPRPDSAPSSESADPDRRLEVGVVAHLVPVKGHPTLLDAVARRPRWRLHIAGRAHDAEYRDALGAQVERLGIGERVRFRGGVDDVPGFLHSLDAFVLPTWARWRMEGCPVALLEAMASGLPSVATDIPGSRDLVENDRSGLLVPPEDASTLAGALERLEGAALRRRLGRGARRRVEAHFAIEREVADHEAIYAEVGGR